MSNEAIQPVPIHVGEPKALIHLGRDVPYGVARTFLVEKPWIDGPERFTQFGLADRHRPCEVLRHRRAPGLTEAKSAAVPSMVR